ncbi:MAG: glutaredoxin, partial [Myxococcota bacterium]
MSRTLSARPWPRSNRLWGSQLVSVLLLSVLTGGCQQDATTARKDADLPATPPTITVTEARKDLIFTYQDPKSGEFTTASKPADVPKKAKRAVVVTDLSLSPKQRQAGRYVYVTDLRTARDDGTYPVAVASRYGFEAQQAATSSAAIASKREVVVYSASWCGVCKTTKRLLKKWRVPFVEKDVE